MQLSFRTKLLASHVALVAAIVLIVILELNRALGADLVRQLDARLEQQALGAAQWVGEGRRHPEKLAGRLALVVHADVAIFDRDGNVVGDSSHADARTEPDARPEVDAARRGEVGRAVRTPPGTRDEIHYVAVPAADGIVVRVSAPISGINATLEAMRARLSFASAVAIAAAVALGWILSSQLKARMGDLTAERDRLSAILAGMVEGVLVIGSDGRVVVANAAAAQIVGGAAPLVGKALKDAVAKDDLRAFVRDAARSGEAREAELESDGRAINVYVRPLASSERAGSVAVLRDMTALRALMTMRREFVANVSHELRTPVAVIQGYAETLATGRADDATRTEFLDVIHRQSQRIGALVDDLLRLAELEARGPERAVREPIEVAALAGHVARAVRERAEQRQATIAVDVADDVVARGDPAGAERVLLNLVDNAIKYGKSGGRVAIGARRAGARVIVTVADDGPGIDARHLPRLFERFYRIDDGRTRERGGTGLGLAIVKHVVEAMSGSVRVESELGKGTRFVVELPSAE
jgi:two-component system phosphate regulon sensor histidine kinase PhoR